MYKIITASLLALSLSAASAQACSFGERSASYKHDQMVSTMPDKAVKKPGEAMSTFDPKGELVFEDNAEKTEVPVKKEITE